MVLSYLDVLGKDRPVGMRVAIVGAGGIGFDVAEFLTHRGALTARGRDAFLAEWGIDSGHAKRGGLSPDGPRPRRSQRQVYLLQRKGSKMGKDLGKTTGWIQRAILRQRGVIMLNAVTYEKIDHYGVAISRRGERQTLAVDTVVVCAGQVSVDTLYRDIDGSGVPAHLIGGARRAVELDAQRAIAQGCQLAASL
jgi:2,4-dienoyl-CoA reductase (NADPH2)